jgi:hypothetical protein
MNHCPFHYLPFAKKIVASELGRPTLTHENSIYFIPQALSSFVPPKTIKRGRRGFFIHTQGSEKSKKLILSELGYLIYLHCMENIDWVSVVNGILYAGSREGTNSLWLLYYALQPFDLVFSQANKEELYDISWQKSTRLRLKQLASLPDLVQKSLTDEIHLIPLIRENIRSLMHRWTFTSHAQFRVSNILEGIFLTEEFKDSKYWICPAVRDGSFDIIFDLLASIYTLYK